MRLNVIDIREVAERHLCCGCGACAYVSPDCVEMVDDFDAGRRPVVRDGARGASYDEALSICPGASLAHDDAASREPGLIPGMFDAWGPILEVWEGWASDQEIRRAGSSGGVASALALHCVEAGGMHGALHIAARRDKPYLNHTVMSRSREELLAATGSRYAPASPCDGLGMIEDAPGECVFIGKPCDAAAAQRARKIRPGLDRNLGAVIAFFCAGTPSTNATVKLLRRMGVDDLDRVRSVRYRGNGWPGLATVMFDDNGVERTETMTYAESWGMLTKDKQWRCRVCPDHTGEFADIAVGDPWYREIESGEAGNSLILVRTERGRALLREAIASGHVVAELADPSILERSQPNLIGARGAVWGRLLGMRLIGAKTPRYRGVPTFGHWIGELSLRDKAQSVFGTVRRGLQRGLARRRGVVRGEVGA